MRLDFQSLRKLEAEHGEAFFICDLRIFRNNYQDFVRAFCAHYANSEIAYSYKTNYLPRLCSEVDRLGGYAEVVSGMEYELALRVGVDPGRIIFNGPYKHEADLRRALLGGALVNLDGEHEVAHVEAIARRHPEATLNVGLRCNFALDGGQESRFGFDVEAGSFRAAIERLEQIDNLVVAGLHCHFSTGQRSVGSYARRTRRLLELTADCLGGRAPRVVNIGGGYFSRMSPALREQFPFPVPTYEDYADAIGSQVHAAFPGGTGPELILEPGAALTADAMRFVAKVAAVKRIGSREIALVAGSIHNIKPTLHQKQLPVTVIPADDAPRERAGAQSTDIVGYTCMEHDYLYRGCEDVLRPGDYVVFENVGAYTIVMKPPFIRPAPAILVIEDDGSVSLGRRAERFDDVFATYSFPAQEQVGPLR